MLPQIGGVGGATLGSLGALLVSEEGADAAKGALIGSTLGFVVGGIVETSRPERMEQRRHASLRPSFLPDLPGDWTASVTPATLEGGQPGIQAMVRATGW